jgi:hypothetical protein
MTSRAGYWIGAGLIVLGVAGAILWGVLSFAGMGDEVEDFVRAPAPGAARVELEERKYIVYVEGPGVGEDYSPPVDIVISDPAGDAALALADYSGSLSYSMNGHSGSAVATVTPPRAGVYSLRAATTAGPAAGLQVALGDSIAGRIVRTILGAFAIGGLGLVAGIGLIVATAVRRKRRRGADLPPPPPPPSSEHSGVAGLPGLPGGALPFVRFRVAVGGDRVVKERL